MFKTWIKISFKHYFFCPSLSLCVCVDSYIHENSSNPVDKEFADKGTFISLLKYFLIWQADNDKKKKK